MSEVKINPHCNKRHKPCIAPCPHFEPVTTGQRRFAIGRIVTECGLPDDEHKPDP